MSPERARRLALGALAATAFTAAAGLALLLAAGDALCSLRLFAPAAPPSASMAMNGMDMAGMAMPSHHGVCPILLAACAIALVMCILSVFALLTGGAAGAGEPLEAAVGLALRWLRALRARGGFEAVPAPAAWRLAAATVPVARSAPRARRRSPRAPPLR